MMAEGAIPPLNRKINHVTPLRYPGGKAKLAPFIKRLIVDNGLSDGEYAEPFAGGAGIALEILVHEYVSRVHINDLSRPVYAFWHSVLNRTEELVRKVRSAKPSVALWDKQKRILANESQHDELELGFATFFLNRTNRSGILNGGIIGGREQTGTWGIDARYNGPELAARIETIARLRRRITLTCLDAMAFLKQAVRVMPARSLIYLDPPYYVKGRDLYYHYYEDADHRRIANFVQKKIVRQRWIISYDNVKAVRELYAGRPGMTYGLGYSAREVRSGSEVMYFGDNIVVPQISGAMRPLTGGARPKISVYSTRARP